MSAEKNSPELEQISRIELNGRAMDVFEKEMELPCDPQKEKVCEQHIADGLANELYSDFWMQECDFPREGDDPRIIIQFTCKGISAIRKRCRLTLTQYDPNGKVLNKGKITD